MALFTSIRCIYRSTGENRDTHTIKHRWGHVVWVTLPTGERHRVLVSTGTHNQNINVSYVISGHHIAAITASDKGARADWRRYPQEAAQACVDRICKRHGTQLVADALRQCAIVGPPLNPEWTGRP